MTATADLLRRARALIARPEDWSDNGWGHGGKRCLLHALRDSGTWSDYFRAMQAIYAAVGLCAPQVSTFNDTHTHAEVLALLDRAISQAEARR